MPCPEHKGQIQFLAKHKLVAYAFALPAARFSRGRPPRFGSGDTADALVVSQPAVSAALAGLQTRGRRQADRARRTQDPPDRSGPGLRTLRAPRLRAPRRGARERAQRSQGASAGGFGIAAVTTAAEHLVPEMLQTFRAAASRQSASNSTWATTSTCGTACALGSRSGDGRAAAARFAVARRSRRARTR